MSTQAWALEEHIYVVILVGSDIELWVSSVKQRIEKSTA